MKSKLCFVSLLAATLFAVAEQAHAAITVYHDRAAFEAVSGTTRVIKFDTTDQGDPVTDPPSQTYFPYLGLRGVCFQSLMTYYNLLIYNFPNSTTVAGLPQNTYAVGTNWFPWYVNANLLTVNVSVGGVVHAYPFSMPAVAWEHPFLGFISDAPIDWISFTLDNAYIGIHDFTINDSAGMGHGCPPPADSEGPVTSDVTLTPNPVAVDTSVALTAVVDDNTTGGSDITGAEYSVASGPFAPMTGVFNAGPAANVSAALTGFSEPGVYDVCVRGSDSAGNVGQLSCSPLPVFDPAGGFVTGGGWIMSPQGAYRANPVLSGKASFGFVAKYKKGANVPTGNTQFVFQAAGFRFESSSYDWLVIAGARAQYKGTGSINGQPGFQFMLTAVDGDMLGGNHGDTFRLKVTSDEGLIYDNQLGASDDADPTGVLGGGSIVIHKN